ncbi:MAG: threonine synthase [Candidatus Thorarchaeota archaeon]|nr:threonine synthase [Candidatus Thorarchaeota archaeon]
MISHLIHLECPQCRKSYTIDSSSSYCICGSPLFAIYDLIRVIEDLKSEQFPSEHNSMWRYSQLLPVKSPSFIISLGEGWTPLTISRRVGSHLGLRFLMIKDESQNPTGSFKDRGLCAAVSKHLELGAESFSLPSAGNAAVSLSAYCAAAGASCSIFMPSDTPEPFFQDCEMYGAEVCRVDGDISKCAEEMKMMQGKWTDLSTTKEPYRVEGKKTLAFEIVEQLGWEVPDAIVCPTGGGTAIIGIWKGLSELEALGLIDEKRPRLYAAQSAGCAPIVKAFEMGVDNAEAWPNGDTTALGLRVPKPFGDRLILKTLRQSGGSGVAVAEDEIEPIRKMAAKLEGLNMCPESAVGLAGLRNLVEMGEIDYDEEVVLLNTGSGARYYYNSKKDATT